MELVQIFFRDLNEKDPDLFTNILPDAIDKLSQTEENKGISEEKFENFARYILEFVKDSKIDKLIYTLVDNLRKKGGHGKSIRNITRCLIFLIKNDKNL